MATSCVVSTMSHSHDTDDVSYRELVAADSTSNNVEEIVTDLVRIVLFQKVKPSLKVNREWFTQVGEGVAIRLVVPFQGC